MTANGELLPIFIICDSDCEDPEQQRVELELVAGMPEVVGEFGGEKRSFKQLSPALRKVERRPTFGARYLSSCGMFTLTCHQPTRFA